MRKAGLQIRRWVQTAAVVCLAAVACPAQDAPAREMPAQNLTIWIVRPVTAADHALQRAEADLRDISTYHESTAGSFGKSASDVGQTAGSYGALPSEVGQNASSVGTNAGDYGQTASSLPSNVPSQTAGSYGQTAGSFGTSASEFSGAPRRTTLVAETTVSRDSKGVAWPAFLSALHDALPNLQVRVTEVNGTELRQLLTNAAGTAAAPDVLLSDRMPDWFGSVSRTSVLKALGSVPSSPGVAGGAKGGHRQTVYAAAYGLASARHATAAREFLEWWYDQGFSPLSSRPAIAKLSPAAAVAQAAVGQVLSGSPLAGLGDKDIAEFSSVATRAEALNLSADTPPDVGFRVDVLQAQSNDRFAVVLLHAQCLSRTAFCDLLPLVMLRQDAHGDWKVLQLSLEMNGSDAEQGFGLAAGEARPAKLAEVSLPKLASPVDGDERAVRAGLKLWWDNGGGASLLVVEWQAGSGSGAPASHVYLVPDTDPKVSTEVPAPFTNVGGLLRWRVWAVGAGGVVRLTDWRTVHMVQ